MPTKPVSSNPLVDDQCFCWEGYMCVRGATDSHPSDTLTASTDFLIIKGVLGNFCIERDSVKRIGRNGFYPWLLRGLRIDHNMPGSPAGIRFWPSETRSKHLLEQLRVLGYPVK